ncbi:hypothetical protein MWK73_19730 [Escherichia coli]|nr:hypothetical protein [Escherichia coli]
MPSCFFKGWAFGFYNVMLSGVFKAVLLGNTLQFRVIAEIFQGGFVVFQQQFTSPWNTVENNVLLMIGFTTGRDSAGTVAVADADV